jgi:hypothetical protein
MKPILAAVVYLLMGFVLALGIAHFMHHGRLWLLMLAAVGYLLASARFGCLPGKSH